MSHVQKVREFSEGGLERRLRDAESLLAETQRLAQVGSWSWDIASDEVSWSDEMYRLYGISPQEFEATYDAAITLVHPDDRWLFDRHIGGVLDGSRDDYEFEFRVIRADGQRRWFRGRGQVVRDEQGNALRLFGTVQDITASRETEQKLTHLAFRDPLTGLANRSLLVDRVTHALARREQHRTDVLLLDLDDFKTINDVSGHAAGDQLLVEVARRLLTCVRPEDTVARLGGDEFAILLEDADGDADVDAVAERVKQALFKPVTIRGRLVVPKASIGIGRNDDGTHDPDQLMLRADVAMYAAKAAGKGEIKTFSADMADAIRERADLEAALRQAVARGEIEVHYQPIIDLSTGFASRVEALVRWRRPQGLVAPDQFLGVAESSSLIKQIGAEVLRQALSTLGSWLSDDPRRSVAVNVSAVQLRDARFAEDVLKLVETMDARPDQLVLEVTESLFLDPEPQLVEQLDALRERAVRVSIDDFGTGYSSLGRLQTLPVDSLKIDKSFVSDLHTGHEDLPILTSMIVMAHNLGLDVTAEGVETATQAQRLVALGCDYLQGYHFARPTPADQLVHATNAATEATRELGLDRYSGKLGQVIVVEDDPVTRHLVSTALTVHGWLVHETDTVAEGELIASATSRVDCIIVDVTLPDGDGIDLVAALRTRPHLASTPIIVVTGTADRKTKVRAFTAGADDYIVKPITGPQLLARVLGAIRQVAHV